MRASPTSRNRKTGDCLRARHSLGGRFPVARASRAASGGKGRGPMAEWLRRGLQILARRFDSGSGLHFSQQCESAALAQLVEHIIRNDGVRCSSHLSGTIFQMSTRLPEFRSEAEAAKRR